jgi:hypothetical protein
MNNKDYAKKAKKKIEIAEKNNLILICLYPDENWKEKINEFLRII